MKSDRRRMLGLGALGVGAAALEGCASFPSAVQGGPATADEVEQMLVDLDRVLTRVDAHDADPARFGIRARGSEVAAGRDQFRVLLRTLCFMGTYSEVPAAVWQSPRVRARLERALPRIQATLASAHDQIAGLDDEMIARIDDRLGREPELPMQIMEHVDAQAKAIDVPIGHRTYLRMSTMQLAQRYRQEGARAASRRIAGSYGRMVDRRLATLGVDVGEPGILHSDLLQSHAAAGRSVVATGNLLGAPKNVRRGSRGESCEVDHECENGLSCTGGTCGAVPTSKELMKTARKLAIVGAWCMIPPACGVGILLLLHALFIVIVAGIVHAGEE